MGGGFESPARRHRSGTGTVGIVSRIYAHFLCGLVPSLPSFYTTPHTMLLSAGIRRRLLRRLSVDLLFLALIVGFFVASILLAVGCARL